jgi:hypothetical protein
VWSRDVAATNENSTNSSFDDIYYLLKNTDMAVVDGMVRSSLLRLTGTNSIASAWDSLFVHFNSGKGKGAVGYQTGEKIFLRINGIGSVVKGASDHSFRSLTDARMARTAPQPVLALLRTLIIDYGVPQENISVGDPMKDISDEYWNIWTAEFPNVSYICNKGGQGRIKAAKGTAPSVAYSDRGSVLRTGGPFGGDMSLGDPVFQDTLYAVVEQADYMVYVAALKVHERAGITALGKLDFGSQTRQNAKHLHMGLINPDEPLAGNQNSRFGYHLYRVQVDLMGHHKLGGNAVLFLVDGLWSGTGANKFAVKFQIPPFNGDWPSSIFVSQDPVALESVCYDIMKAEFTSERHSDATYPQMVGVDDYLHQAADSANWPAGVRYDPENDGTVLGSLGAHEHWNNATAMQYSRNLGTGNGIELVKIDATVGVADGSTSLPLEFTLEQNYPNPFNPETIIEYRVSGSSTALGPKTGDQVRLSVFDLQGREVAVLVDGFRSEGAYQAVWDASDVPSGVYFYRITAGVFTQTRKMLLMR